jgi:hypothetical protein
VIPRLLLGIVLLTCLTNWAKGGDNRVLGITITPYVYGVDSSSVILAVIRNESPQPIKVWARSGQYFNGRPQILIPCMSPVLITTSPGTSDSHVRIPLIRSRSRGWLTLNPGDAIEGEVLARSHSQPRQVAVLGEGIHGLAPRVWRSTEIDWVKPTLSSVSLDSAISIAKTLGFHQSPGSDVRGGCYPSWELSPLRKAPISRDKVIIVGPAYMTNMSRWVWYFGERSDFSLRRAACRQLCISALTGVPLDSTRYVMGSH